MWLFKFCFVNLLCLHINAHGQVCVYVCMREFVYECSCFCTPGCLSISVCRVCVHNCTYICTYVYEYMCERLWECAHMCVCGCQFAYWCVYMRAPVHDSASVHESVWVWFIYCRLIWLFPFQLVLYPIKHISDGNDKACSPAVGKEKQNVR